MKRRYVAYYRVSTQKQGQSGLGLDAQRHSVNEFISQYGGEVIDDYVEVESGKKADRPEFTKAAGLNCPTTRTHNRQAPNSSLRGPTIFLLIHWPIWLILVVDSAINQHAKSLNTRDGRPHIRSGLTLKIAPKSR